MLAWHLLRPSVSMAVEAAAASEHVPTHSTYPIHSHTSTLPFSQESVRSAVHSRRHSRRFSCRRFDLSRCDYASIVVHLRTPGLHSALRGAGLCLRGRAPYTHGDDKHSITVIPVRTHGVDPNDKHIPECNKRAPPAAHAKPARRPWPLCALLRACARRAMMMLPHSQ